MNLEVKHPHGVLETVVEIKKAMIIEFQRTKLEDQFMNEMIEVRKKPEESVWDIDKKFNTLKGKMKYPIFDMQHKQLFINSLLPHFKYPLRYHKFQNQEEALQEMIQLEENQYKKTDPSIEEVKEDLKNLRMRMK